MEHNGKKAFGAYVATVVKKLKRSGLKSDALMMALAAVKVKPDPVSVKLPMKVRHRMADLLASERRVVVSRHGKGLKVWSYAGYQASMASSSRVAHSQKPWIRSAKLRADAKAAKAAKSTK